MAVVFTVERHHEVLDLWRREDRAGLRVVHLDFHCDMRGLLVDRSAGLAYRIRDGFPDLDQGNFLTHGVIEGRIDAIRWVHDDPGGRAHDMGTVKYESDVSALPHRILLARRRTPGIPLAYEVVRSRDWEGVREGEVLDIDWDYFTCMDYDPSSITDRLDAFWQADSGVVPEETYVSYSPEYSHPSRDRYAAFIDRLAARFDARVVNVEAPAVSKPPNRRGVSRHVPAGLYRAGRNAYRRTALALKQRGVF